MQYFESTVARHRSVYLAADTRVMHLLAGGLILCKRIRDTTSRLDKHFVRYVNGPRRV